jgi:hypothetical protein
MISKPGIRFAIALGLLAWCPTPRAHAGYVAGFSLSSITVPPPGTGAVDSHNFDNITPATMLTPTTVTSTTTAAGAQANGLSTASLGALKTYGYTYQPPTGSSFTYSQTHEQINTLDTITVVGKMGQALGTPVQLKFTLDLHGSFVDKYFPFENYESVTTANYLGSSSGGGSVSLSYQTAPAKPANSFQTTILQTAVGDTVTIQAGLDSVTYVGGDSANSLAIQDYSSTMHYYIDAITPGIQVVSAAGYDYSTSVPEPSSIILLSAGSFFALTCRLTRGRRG